MEDKNNALSPFEEIYLEEGFYVLKIQNNSPLPQKLTKAIDSSYIQFHFCLKGSADFLFNEGAYSLTVSEEQSTPKKTCRSMQCFSPMLGCFLWS